MPEKNIPDVAIFPDLNVRITTPAGRSYRGRALVHPSQHADGETWLQISNLRAVGADKESTFAMAVAGQAANKGNRPSYFPAESIVMPLDLKLNRIPTAKRADKNADTLVGELWDVDGLWTILAKPSKSDGLQWVGSALPAKCEIENNPGSKIAKYQRPAAPGETAAEHISAKTHSHLGNG